MTKDGDGVVMKILAHPLAEWVWRGLMSGVLAVGIIAVRAKLDKLYVPREEYESKHAEMANQMTANNTGLNTKLDRMESAQKDMLYQMSEIKGQVGEVKGELRRIK